MPQVSCIVAPVLSYEDVKEYEEVTPRNAGVLFDVIWLRYRYKTETWTQLCLRQVNYSYSNYSGHKSVVDLKQEALEMFDMMFHLESLPSGRSMRIGGTPASEKYQESNFNCCFCNIDSLESFCEVFHLSLCSCGIGFKITRDLVSKLPELNCYFEVNHREYNTVFPGEKQEETYVIPSYDINLNLQKFVIYVGDSKQGWVDALRQFFSLIQEHHGIKTLYIEFDYDYVRPEGTKLQTWGGRAAGPQGLKRMFEKLEKIIKTCNGKLRPIDCLDFCNIIGANVVVGGTRRAAMIALFSPEDQECIEAKFGDKTGWLGYVADSSKVDYFEHYEKVYGKEIAKQMFAQDKYEGVVDWIPNPETDHRTMSNNSMVFESKPTLDKLKEVIEYIRFNGEPGFFNLEAARKRRPNAEGINPCAEVLMDSKAVCNLSTVPWTSHLHYGKYGWELDRESISKAYRNAVRIGIRQTNVTLSLPEWDKIQKRDRLIGPSITGEMDALDKLGWENCGPEHKELLSWLKSVCKDEVSKYSYELRIPQPLLTTLVKPEGSLSLLTKATSYGVHRSYAPHYIRRLKFASFEPTAKALIELGVSYEKDKTKKESNRLVFEFPLSSDAKISAQEESFLEQFKRYLLHQEVWSEHNTSITFYVGEDEWDQIPQLLFDNWDDIVAVSFLAKGYKGTQMPYEEKPEDYISDKKTNFPNLNFLYQLVDKYEDGEQYEVLDEACAGGVCPVV